MAFLKLTEQDVRNKTVLIRADLNVPLQNGVITDDTRIRASMASVRYCLEQGAGVILMSHLGRPKEGVRTADDDVAPVAKRVGELLGTEVAVADDWRENPPKPAAGEVLMLQNVRCNVGEKANDAALGRAYAALCDVYVNDAFGTAHRAEASLVAVAEAAPVACAGVLLAAELDALGRALAEPKRPLVAIVAGSKVSTKLTVLNSLADKVDHLIVGGGIANTFLLAQGKPVGKSLAEPDLVGEAEAILAKMAAKGGLLPLPEDVVCAKTFAADAPACVKDVRSVEADDMILDIGPKSAQALAALLADAGTVVWNGPVGVFEFDAFANGTRVMAEAIADSSAFSIAGGGDTLAAIARFGVGEGISYISTGGGAFLEFLEGRSLPGVAVLERRAAV